MTAHRTTEYLVVPTGFETATAPEKMAWGLDWTWTVAWRGTDTDFWHGWAICHGGRCMNHDGEWEHEPSPSNRDHDFLARCRWVYPSEALSFAHHRIDYFKVNGRTFAEVLGRDDYRD